MSPLVVIDHDRLEALMAAQVLDTNELARRSGIHRITIGGIRRGDYRPARATIRKIAAALGVEPSEITRVETLAS